jgi:hypothetical protein
MARRFNHMELTLPRGALSQGARAEIRAFYADLFGWDALDVPILRQTGLLLRTDPETSQFILLTEQRLHLSSPGCDHLGLLCDSRAEVDALLARAKDWQRRDPRVEIKEYADLVSGPVTTHAFYVRFLLPIWIDVQVLEYAPGAEPPRRWEFGAAR